MKRMEISNTKDNHRSMTCWVWWRPLCLVFGVWLCFMFRCCLCVCMMYECREKNPTDQQLMSKNSKLCESKEWSTIKLNCTPSQLRECIFSFWEGISCFHYVHSQFFHFQLFNCLIDDRKWFGITLQQNHIQTTRNKAALSISQNAK